MEQYYRLSEAAKLIGVSVDTLRKWDRLGRIKTTRTPGGHRRIPLSEIKRILNIQDIQTLRCAIYARVSSHTREEDLERQIITLKELARKNGWIVVKTIKDISSGLKERRRGLRQLYKLVKSKAIDLVLITYKDRLTRFGFSYIEEFFKSHNVQIFIAFENPEKTELQELVEDFIAIITSFAGGIYGRRSKKIKKLLEELS